MERKDEIWYLTRYATTKGVVEIENGKVTPSGLYVSHGFFGLDEIGVSVFADPHDAQADCRVRIEKAIASTEKKLLKLKKKLMELEAKADAET